jgi:hypothetical protein
VPLPSGAVPLIVALVLEGAGEDALRVSVRVRREVEVAEAEPDGTGMSEVMVVVIVCNDELPVELFGGVAVALADEEDGEVEEEVEVDD